MPRYFLELSYDGTSFSGWQVQSNSPSVQETINVALSRLSREEVRSMGCGRTDAGVHAKLFYMHFDLLKAVEDPADLIYRLNGMLPDSIAIHRLIPVHDKAHTRFDAVERGYEYFIHFDKSPYLKLYSFYQGYYRLDFDKIAEASRVLTEVEDFTSLCLPSEDFKTNLCNVNRARWELLPQQHLVLKPYDPEPAFRGIENLQLSRGELLRFSIHSNRFLRGMVRRIVGTLLMVGKGKISVAEFEDTVRAKGAFRVHHLAPPNGLYLSRVVYEYLPIPNS